MAKAFKAGLDRTANRVLLAPVGSSNRVTRYKHFSGACSEGKCSAFTACLSPDPGRLRETVMAAFAAGVGSSGFGKIASSCAAQQAGCSVYGYQATLQRNHRAVAAEVPKADRRTAMGEVWRPGKTSSPDTETECKVYCMGLRGMGNPVPSHPRPGL